MARENHNEELFEKLKEIRNKIAKGKKLPEFRIFSDSILKELSYYYANDKKLFLKIEGIGATKFEKYGNKFLSTINEFVKGLDNIDKRHEELKEDKKSRMSVKERTELRKLKIKELILEKVNLENIALKLELTTNTIVNYVGRLLTDDPSLDVEYIKESVPGYKDIVKAFEKHGTEKIGPIYNELGGNVEYPEINLVKVLLLSK